MHTLKGKYAEDAIPGVRELTCRIFLGTGTKWTVDLCGKVVNSSEVSCGLCLALGERWCKVW